MSDVHDTDQRAAARSTVALALERWGCCCDPSRWDFSHLREDLFSSLRRAKCKLIGDAFLLACILFEGSGNEEVEEDRLGAQRQSALGRWECSEPLVATDPFHLEAAHFKAPKSALLFEPVENGGLGMLPSGMLLKP
jgi:hypothetical protein